MIDVLCCTVLLCRGEYAAKSYDNPWVAGGRNAPFDQKFYFVINLAVGGTNGYTSYCICTAQMRI